LTFEPVDRGDHHLKTVLVTGGAGYIGSHVVRQLSEAGHEVIVYDNLATGFADALILREKLIVGDLADSERLEMVFQNHRIDAVLHFAASIVAPESVTDPLKYYANNTANTLQLIKTCVRHQVDQLVFSSTAAVYGEPPSGIASEDTAPAPMNPYGSSKLMSEWILRDAAKAHGFRYVALRYFNVAGADPQGRMGQRTPEATHLIKVCCQAALGKRERVYIYGTDYPTPDGTGVRDYIHIEDLASAHLAALHYLAKDQPPVTLNVGYGRGSSVREVIQAVKDVSGTDFQVVEASRREGDPAILVARAEWIKNKFNWEPRRDNLITIVTDAWQWEKNLVNRLEKK
jgi:UDP-glucose 4-epimerase